MWTKYDKALVALLVVVLTGLNGVYGANHTVQLLISLAGALGVFSVPNKA